MDLAWQRMVQVCFRPFNLDKWFGLGFAAWIANLILGGSGINFSYPVGDFDELPELPIGPTIPHNIGALLRQWAPLLLAGCGIAIAVALLLTWLSSRGHFMFIHGIAHNEGAVAAPWRDYRSFGNSLFRVRAALLLAFAVAALGSIAVGLHFILPGIEHNPSIWKALGALAPLLTMVGLLGLVYSIAEAILIGLVAPTMYASNLSVGSAWGLCKERMFPNNKGSIALFLVVKLGLDLGAGIVSAIAVVATCCLAALPYVGTVILLPVYVFLRSFALYYVTQIGDGFGVFPAQPPPTRDIG